MRFLIRVDADPEIGSGHFMRMVALAQLLQDRSHEAHFATASHNDLCDAYLAENHLQAHPVPASRGEDAHALLALARALRAAWVVLDGQRFDTAYQRVLHDGGCRVMSVDDLGLGHFASDVVLNQNYGTENLPYSTEPYTRLLLGLRYVLLRREFRTANAPLRGPGKQRRHVLVSFGGTLRPGLLARTLDALLARKRPNLSVTLVVGAFDTLDAALAESCRTAGPSVTLIRHSRHMAEIMRSADAAITAAGSTMWELLHMRVPFLALPLNDAQDAYLERLARDAVCARFPYARDPQPEVLAERFHAFLEDQALHERILARTVGLIDPRRAERLLSAVFET
jgi:UDP-2,4-diacetamido-2,4,6-trideoxy-beta-L-altropyranose hydrolase